MQAIGWWLGIAAALFLLDRLLLRAEKAGWLYYRKIKPNPGSLSSALAQIQGVFEPAKRHVAEVQQKPVVQEDEQGARPNTLALFAVQPASNKKV